MISVQATSGRTAWKLCLLLTCFVSIALFAAGCSTGSQKAAPAPDTSPNHDAPADREASNVEGQPVAGGTVVMASGQDIDSLNPLYAETIAGYEVIHAVFSGLNRLNDKLEFEPDLATNVPTLENGQVVVDGETMTVEYSLRHDVLWHDGEPFDARDVVFTWKAFTHPDNPVISPQGYDQIETVEMPDPYTVRIVFKSLVPDYQSLFNTILPQHVLGGSEGRVETGDAYNRRPLGTGPFRVSEWNPGRDVVLVANKEYYGEGPYLERIVYRIVPDPSVRLSQLETGEADIIKDYPPERQEELTRMDGVTVHAQPNLYWEHLDFNLYKPLFQDAAVRQALKWAIDREQIVETVYRGTRRVATGDQSPLSWAFHSGIKVNPRNVDRARQILEDAGWQRGVDGIYEKDGQRLAFSISATSGDVQREQIEQIIQQQAYEAGFEIEIRNYDFNTLFGDVLVNRRHDTILFAWQAGVDPDDFALWHSSQIPDETGVGQNYVGYRSEVVDALLFKAHTTLDREIRRQAYLRVQEEIDLDVPIIPISYGANLSAVRSELVNYLPSPANNGNLWNAGSWWWRPGR